jgi:hypothetical protein
VLFYNRLLSIIQLLYLGYYSFVGLHGTPAFAHVYCSTSVFLLFRAYIYIAHLRVRPYRLREFERFWITNVPRALNLAVTSPGGNAYGEYSAGSIWKVYVYLTIHANLTPADIVLDWGAGLMKVCVGLAFLSGCTALGIERETSLHNRSQDVVSAAKRAFGARVAALNCDSAKIVSFVPISIVVCYDGPTDALYEEDHYVIMRNAFLSPTVRAVVSTQMSQFRFEQYFPDGFRFWRCVQLGSMCFGRGSYKVYLWLRRRPSNNTSGVVVDSRMASLLVEAHKK